uniref:hypothetical protein n=1 Tax=Rhodaphanes brevistipitata TaxID=446136 RepID=UPI001FCDFEBA|nr:hypothetical protein MW432_pgp084 [Rhodaphanes brevistipitata]UNJ18497.1 hypothetical protein [Rhodaphanes brevistipitata]
MDKVSLLGSVSKQFTTIIAYFVIVFILLVITQIIYKSSKFIHKTESLESNLLMLYLSVIPYGIPFLEAFNNFGKYTMPHLPLTLQIFYNDYLRHVLEGSYVDLNILYVILLFSQYIIFIQPKRLKKFTRYHMLHSILVYLITSLMGIIYWALPDSFTQNLYGELTCDLCLLICMSMIIHAFVKALLGQYCQIPVISEAVRIHLEGY